MADNRVNLICVPPDRLKQVWPKVSGLIHIAMKRGGLGSFASVQDDVLNGDALLWVGFDGAEVNGACVSQITQTEWRKVCTIIACSGTDMNRWIGLIEQIEGYARGEGCSAMRIIGRLGWQAVLTSYRPHRVVLQKDL